MWIPTATARAKRHRNRSAAARCRVCRIGGPLGGPTGNLITSVLMGAPNGSAQSRKFGVNWRWSIARTCKFLLARCDLFTAVNALERAECVLKLPSIVKVAATRQNAAGSPQTVAKEAKPPEGPHTGLRH